MVADLSRVLPAGGITVKFSIEYSGTVTVEDIKLASSSDMVSTSASHTLTGDNAVANIPVSVLEDSTSEMPEMFAIRMELAGGGHHQSVGSSEILPPSPSKTKLLVAPLVPKA